MAMMHPRWIRLFACVVLAGLLGCDDAGPGGGGDADPQRDAGRDRGATDDGQSDAAADTAPDAADAADTDGDDSPADLADAQADVPAEDGSGADAADAATDPGPGEDQADTADAEGDVALDGDGPDGSGSDAAPDADAGSTSDTAADAADDGEITRTTLLPAFCPSTVMAPGYYQGTLASNLNDIDTSSCTGAAPGRDGAVRIELEPGQTVSADYRHDGDGILYVLDSCPVTGSCLEGSNASSSGQESVSWTNDGGATNPIYIVLDSSELGGAQTFELDLFVDE